MKKHSELAGWYILPRLVVAWDDGKIVLPRVPGEEFTRGGK